MRPNKPRKVADFEEYIKVKAMQYAKRNDDIPDFEQVARLAAWAAIQDDPHCTKSYVYQRITWRMNDFWKRGIYKNPQELSVDEHFGNQVWGQYTGSDDM